MSAQSVENMVLLLSAQPDLTRRLKALLESVYPHMAVQVIERGETGLATLYAAPRAAVVVDASLPDISGVQICRVLKHDPTLQKIPLMLISRSEARDYVRLGELAPLADAWVCEDDIEQTFAPQMSLLLKLYEGLDPDEREQIELLQKTSAKVQPLTRMVQLLDQSVTENALMKSFKGLFELAPNKNLLHHMLFRVLETVVDYDLAVVFFNDKNREPRLLSFHNPHQYTLRDEQLLQWTAQILDPLKAKSSEPWNFQGYRHEVVAGESATTGPTFFPQHQAVYPFYVEDTLIGALILMNTQEVHYDLLFPFPLVLQELSALMRMRRYYSEAEMLSISDAFTGLYTHPHFMWCLDREIRQARRHQLPLTLALFRMDQFQALNERFGHEVGDRAIQHLSGIILEGFRNLDLFTRAGTYKILGLFPNTPPDAAMIAIERVQKAVVQSRLPGGHADIPLSVTVGMCALTDEIASASQFVIHTQKALDKALQNGQTLLEAR